MKKPSLININDAEIVTLRQEADRIENSPAKMLDLIDLIFGLEPSKYPPS